MGVIFLVFFIILGWCIFQQIKFATGLKSWAGILKRKDASQSESEEVLTFLMKTKWVPNHPKYWGYCKTIYHSILVSKDVHFETKMDIFHRLDKLKCYGIVRPIDKSKKFT
ncbi:hypothetical protein [Bacillus sp. FJAT-49736]|uniref:hypothetical protein n=1 Tax=Bacillus sp. FJAT-49736 TaxID=2833582 RepID=UPI001BC90F21|nr:hypothetical protein [Bacillus sp. FJAT-49736]MBS4174304.1 hypothetical protein [Bacillus sp. FJAT-49736]